MTRSHLFVLAATTLLVSCAHLSRSSRPNGSIRGLVLSGADLQPVVGATITAGRRHVAKTGTDGVFRIDSIAAGEHRLTLRAAGFADTAIAAISVQANDSTCAFFLPRQIAGVAQAVADARTQSALLIVNGIRYPNLQVPLESSNSSSPISGNQLRIRKVGGPLPSVFSRHIESIEVVRGAAAFAIYGPAAAYGAILITTREQGCGVSR